MWDAEERRVGSDAIREAELDTLFGPLARYETLILAVSGGVDSIALMHLAAEWAGRRRLSRPDFIVATVDHGLRPESAGEAYFVAGEAQKLALPHRVLVWSGPKPRARVQACARQARYALLADLATGLPRAAIVTAHHADDQAETLVMRLARGSGLDGLASIPSRRGVRAAGRRTDVVIERPLLAVAKHRLVATARARGADWRDDPSNGNESFERVRWRKVLPQLGELGLTVRALARSARRLARARAALEAFAGIAWDCRVKVHSGAFAAIGRTEFRGQPEEIQLRLLMRALAAFGGEAEPAELSQVEATLDRLDREENCRFTLGGCLIEADGGEVRIFRETGRCPLPELTVAPDGQAIWDRRFAVGVPCGAAGAVIVRALGERGVALLLHSPSDVADPMCVGTGDLVVEVDVKRRLKALPRVAALTLPSFWVGARLAAVPHLAWHDAAYGPMPVGWAEFLGTQATQK